MNKKKPAKMTGCRISSGENQYLYQFHVCCVQTFWAFLNIIAYLISFTNLIVQTALMHKNIFPTIVGGNESKTFGIVEELYCTIATHDYLIYMKLITKYSLYIGTSQWYNVCKGNLFWQTSMIIPGFGAGVPSIPLLS